MSNQHELAIPGCRVFTVPVHGDARGRFVKPYTKQALTAAGLALDWAECFWSESRRGVVRGFHIQLPPSEHGKLIWAVSGASHSIVLDLRAGSPTYGWSEAVHLDAENGHALYAPEGVAHAFQALEDRTILTYLVSSAHDAARDAGVRWDSTDASWPLPVTEVSARDRALPVLSAFTTPFRYAP